MINIYICPKCFNYRMVSRRPKPDCYHCSELLEKTDIEYEDYIYMTLEERDIYRQGYKKRVLKYRKELNPLWKKDNIIKE